MHRLMPGLTQSTSKRRRQLRIHEKKQSYFAAMMGWSA
jgi:hypothetical protein